VIMSDGVDVGPQCCGSRPVNSTDRAPTSGDELFSSLVRDMGLQTREIVSMVVGELPVLGIAWDVRHSSGAACGLCAGATAIDDSK
jgi:hypothetical protein